MRVEGLPAHHTLKDGTPVTIRLAGKDDGKVLLDFFRSLPEEDRLYLRDDVTKQEYMDRFIKSIDCDSVFSIVAEVKGKVVGEATLYRTSHGWMSHVGEIRLVVERAQQQKGLGTELAREIVRIAVNRGLDKMIFQMADGQVGARKAFEKLGFKQEAVLKRHVKDIRGRYGDLIIMSNDVSHLWEALEVMTADFPHHDGAE